MFLITALGQAAITNAAANNTTVVIQNYKLGSNFGYTPLASQVGLGGAVLYTGALEGAIVIDPNNIKYIINLDTSIGHFAFGEVGLFLGNGDMFAIEVFPNPVVKDKAGDQIGSSLGNTIGLEAHLSMYGIYNAISYIPTDSYSLKEVKTYPSMDFVPSPVSIADYNLVAVTTNRFNDSALSLVKGDLNLWSPSSYTKVGSGLVASLAAPLVLNTNLLAALYSSSLVGKYVIQFTAGPLAGIMREVSSINLVSRITLFSPLSVVVPVNTPFNIYQRLETLVGVPGPAPIPAPGPPGPPGPPASPAPPSGSIDKSLLSVDIGVLADEYNIFNITGANHTQYMYKLLREKTKIVSGPGPQLEILLVASTDAIDPYTPGHWFTIGAATAGLDQMRIRTTGIFGGPASTLLLPPGKLPQLRGTNSLATLVYLGANTWILSGDLADDITPP